MYYINVQTSHICDNPYLPTSNDWALQKMPNCMRRRATMLMTMCGGGIWVLPNRLNVLALLYAIKGHFGCFCWRERTSEQRIVVEENHCIWHTIVCHELVKDGMD